MLSTPRVHADEPVFRRRGELILAGIGAAAAFVFQGGAAMVILRSDDAQMADVILPALGGSGVDVSDDAARVALETVAAWWGFSLLAVAALTVVGFLMALARPRRRSTGWWFLGAGLACLIGTQFVLYPVAFPFFLSAALFVLRKPPARSDS